MLKTKLEGHNATWNSEAAIEGLGDIWHIVWVNELEEALANELCPLISECPFHGGALVAYESLHVQNRDYVQSVFH